MSSIRDGKKLRIKNRILLAKRISFFFVVIIFRFSLPARLVRYDDRLNHTIILFRNRTVRFVYGNLFAFEVSTVTKKGKCDCRCTFEESMKAHFHNDRIDWIRWLGDATTCPCCVWIAARRQKGNTEAYATTINLDRLTF